MPTAVYAPPAAFAAISLLLGFVVLFSSRERIWLRVIAFCALIAALPMLWQTSLGLPRPADLDLTKPSGTVVSYVVDEPKSIFVWLVPDSGNPPRAYSFSFEARKALQLQKAFADARKQGTGVRMDPGGGRKPGGRAGSDGDLDQSHPDAGRSGDRATGGPDFYPVPQRADPLKTDMRADNE
jgi:hypothetical protein